MSDIDARLEFTRWCREDVFHASLREAVALQERALDLYAVALFRDLDLASRLKEWTTPTALAEELCFTPSAERALEPLLLRLAAVAGAIETQTIEGGVALRARGELPDPDPELVELRSRVGSLGPDYATILEFMDFGFRNFSRALGEDPEFMDRILSGRAPEYAGLWDRATNTDPIQDVHGAMGAKAAQFLITDGFEMLEVGGGTGNGIRHLLRLFDEHGELDRIQRYTFTDISTGFILGTRRAIQPRYPTLRTEWKYLDINRRFAESRVRGPFDAIYGVNAAHVAKDIVAFLSECLAMLRSGGRVIFAERVRLSPTAMAPRELALNLSVYHRTAANRNPDYRPMHCYLSPENWLKVLRLAGFEGEEILPDHEALAGEFPHQYAVVVTARKP